MAEELTPVSTTERQSRTTGLLWGQIKVGKTTLLQSLPKPILFLMIDPDGDAVVPDHEGIEIMRIYEHDDATIIRYLTDKFGTQVRKWGNRYASYVLDSTTTLGRITLDQAIANNVGASNKGSDPFKPTIDAPGQAAYGSRTSRLIQISNNILRATGSVGAHCWFTAHEDEPKTNNKGDFLHITMAHSGKTINGIGSLVSEVWYLKLHDGKRFIDIAPCFGRKPMGSRMFDMSDAEFQLNYYPELFEDQPHSIARWHAAWLEGGRKKLPLPKPVKLKSAS